MKNKLGLLLFGILMIYYMHYNAIALIGIHSIGFVIFALQLSNESEERVKNARKT